MVANGQLTVVSGGCQFSGLPKLGKKERNDCGLLVWYLLLYVLGSLLAAVIVKHGVDVVRFRHSGVLTKNRDWLLFAAR
jgi:uncharacterized membrane protein YfcA